MTTAMKSIRANRPHRHASWIYYHGSRDASLAAVFEGICLTSQPQFARDYARGGVVLEVEVTFAGLRVDEVEAEDDGAWCGDDVDVRAELAASGVDAIEYADLAAGGNGAEIDCFRVLSERGLAACRVLRVLTIAECDEEYPPLSW